MKPTYTKDKDGNLMVSTQQPINVQRIFQSIEVCNKELATIQTTKNTLLKQVADIADQVPEEADVINANPNIVAFRSTN